MVLGLFHRACVCVWVFVCGSTKYELLYSFPFPLTHFSHFMAFPKVIGYILCWLSKQHLAIWWLGHSSDPLFLRFVRFVCVSSFWKRRGWRRREEQTHARTVHNCLKNSAIKVYSYNNNNKNYYLSLLTHPPTHSIMNLCVVCVWMSWSPEKRTMFACNLIQSQCKHFAIFMIPIRGVGSLFFFPCLILRLTACFS